MSDHLPQPGRRQPDVWGQVSMFYLWVAAGGALGSMARAWIAIAVARFTGPQFPWGTILINIVGSFIIGFFGTLTTSDSRFAVPADIRAFVMIGICGGFTTFSSFSLQTLELARDGRMGQALGNIGLSVAICLFAVTAGHYSAATIRQPQTKAAATGAGTMGNVVVAVLNRPEEAPQLLDAGTHLLAFGGGGRLRALAVRLPPAAAILPSEEVLTADREAAIRAEQEDWAGQLRAVVQRWEAGARASGVRTDWLDLEGDAAQIVAEHGRRADAIVVARPATHEAGRMRECMHAALFETESPVLVVPPGFHGALGQTVAIAWKDDGRAAKAVRASLPILQRAQTVHVLTAVRQPVMPDILAEHDIPTELHAVPDGEGPVAERIIRSAHLLGADLLVMGAYAHGEWREAIFGGVTRYMLAHTDLPLLMRH
jgi:protein CrcB